MKLKKNAVKQQAFLPLIVANIHLMQTFSTVAGTLTNHASGCFVLYCSYYSLSSFSKAFHYNVKLELFLLAMFYQHGSTVSVCVRVYG